MEVITANKWNKEAEKFRRVFPEKCIELGEKALSFSMKEKNDYQQAKALHNIGEGHLWSAEYEKSFEFIYGALNIFKAKNKVKDEGACHYSLGTLFFYLSDYDSALEEYIKSYKAYDEAKDESGLAEAMNGIGSVYYSIGNDEKALKYLKMSLKSCEILENNALKQKVLDGLGRTYKNLNKHDKAIKSLEDCLDLIEKNDGNQHVKAHALNNLGSIYLLKGGADKSEYYFNQSLNLREKNNFKAGQSESYCNLAQVEIQRNNNEKAKELLNKSLELAKQSNNKTNQVNALHYLSIVEESIGNYKSALDFHKQYFELSQELKNDKTDRRTQSLQIRFKAEHEEKEREILKNKNRSLKNYSKNLVQLSEIGKSLMTIKNTEDIINSAYKQVNELMDAPSFGLGILKNGTDKLYFPGYIEDGKVLEGNVYKLSEDRLASICCRNEETILIEDFSKEHHKWLSDFKPPKAGKATASIIYLPFEVPNGTKGVITVQSYKKSEYTEHHINMLKNLSIYMAIAIQNATHYEELEKLVNQRTEEVIKQKEEIESSYKLTSLLNEVGRQLTSVNDFESIFLELHKNVSKLMDASCFGVRLYNQTKNQIEYIFEIENGVVDSEPIYVSMDDDDNYSVWCVKNKEVVFINDNKKEYKKYTNQIIVPTGEMPDSLIFYPLTFGDRTLGLITVQSFQKNAYTEKHVEILKTLASFTAIALENANLVDNLEAKVSERTEELSKQKEALEQSYNNTKLLNEIGRDLTSSLSVEEVIEQIYENINELMDASIVAIGIRNKNEIEIKGAIEKGKKLPDFSYSLDEENSLATICYKRKEEIIITNIEEELSNYLSDAKTPHGERPESIIYLPLIVKNKAIGTISVQSFNKNAYQNYHINILRNLALFSATAIENAGLYMQMENKVKKRTQEVVRQKEQIEKAYENTRLLGHIGQKIISTHDLEAIFDKLHSNVNELMDATIFSIRICDYESHEIEYKYTIESGKRLDGLRVSLDDIDNYSVWCVHNKKDIHISDHANDYKKYTKKIIVVDGELPDSLIFCPMMIGEKVVGVISAQSFKKNAYEEYHLDILRTLAAYTAIAIENASLIANMEDQVKIRTAEVVRQKEIIEEKNKDITDSIQYAQRIQNVILPPMEDLSQNFYNSFVYFKPRDIVSGDFYWIEEVDNKLYFAVVDCTGHGVPGALVSVVGANGLNRCLLEFGLRSPAKILDKLSEIVRETFDKTDGDVKDGMDMALCCLDLSNMKLKYAGAHNPLWIIRKNLGVELTEKYNVLNTEKEYGLIEIKADKQPIGYAYDPKPFNENEIQLYTGDILYLFSDGFSDQFGGLDQNVIRKGGKKFKSLNFKKLLLSIAEKPLDEQNQIIEETFETWKGSLEQVDDVCVIGVRL